jgi:4-cresol dehydrogenase (hydroxylating)
MEVVLANGDLLRTGMGGMSNPKAWQVYKRGCGPSPDGLFMQSNFGVVTRMGLWLMPPPDCYMPGWLTLRKDSDLELLLERLRPLMLDGTIPNQPMIINAVCGISAFTKRDAWYTGDGPMPEAVIEEIARQPGLGRWVMRFALYGDEVIVERQRKLVEDALGTIPGAEITFSKYDGRNLPELENPHERVQAGIPSMALDQMTRWYGGEKGGHIGFSCVAPITGHDGAALRDLVRTGLNDAGLDYSGVIIVQKRAMIHVGLVAPVDGIDGDLDLISATRSALEDGVVQLADAIRTSLNFYRTQESSQPVELGVVTGTAVTIPGFVEQLSEHLRLPLEARVVAAGEDTDAGRLTVAAGLAVSARP